MYNKITASRTLSLNEEDFIKHSKQQHQRHLQLLQVSSQSTTTHNNNHHHDNDDNDDVPTITTTDHATTNNIIDDEHGDNRVKTSPSSSSEASPTSPSSSSLPSTPVHQQQQPQEPQSLTRLDLSSLSMSPCDELNLAASFDDLTLSAINAMPSPRAIIRFENQILNPQEQDGNTATSTAPALMYPQYYTNNDSKSKLFRHCVEDEEEAFKELLNREIENAREQNANMDANKVLMTQFTYHDHDKCTLVHLVSKYNRIHLLEFIYELSPPIIFTRDSKLANSLFYAVMNDSKECAAFLCNAAMTTQPLHNSSSHNLLQNQSQRFVNELDMYGNCCLYLAMQKGYFELADLLILFGANIDISFKTGETMLHRAITERRLDIVEYLCKKGANLLKQNQNNVSWGMIGMINLLQYIMWCDNV